MGRKIVYCAGCGKSLLETDFDRGLASIQEDRPFCADCRPAPPPASSPPPVPKKTSTARIPLATATPRRGQPASPAARRPPVLLLGGAAAALGLVVLLAAVLSSGGGSPAPSAPAPPPAPPVSKPPPRPGGKEAERIEREMREQKDRERGRRLELFLEDIRRLIKTDRRLERRAEIETMIEAAFKDAGDRRADVEKLRAEYQKWLAEAPRLLSFVAHWTLDEPAGSAAEDATGNGRTGTLEGGPSRVPGKRGGALAFDGKDDGVLVPSAADLSPHAAPGGEMALSAWVLLPERPKAAGQGRTPAVSKGDVGAYEYALYAASDGRAAFCVWTLGGTGCVELYGGSLALNRWHHLAAVLKKGAFTKLYVDGAVVNQTGAFVGESSAGPSPLYLGRRGDGQFFKGTIDDVRLYARALTDAEVRALAEGRDP